MGRDLFAEAGISPVARPTSTRDLFATADNTPIANNPALDYGGLPFRPFGVDTGLTMPQGLANFMAGGGKSIADAARGIGGLVGAVSGQDIKDSRKQDAPLTDTKAGLGGDVIGNLIMALAPGGAVKGASMIPAIASRAPALAPLANILMAPKTIPQALSVGAGMGLTQPAENWQERGLNTGIGAVATSAVPALSRAVRAATSTLEPLYEGGQNTIIGRAFNRAAGSESAAADAARNMAGATELVPGSLPTAAETAQNPGIAALQRAAAAINPTAYGQRVVDQNLARANAVRSIAGTDADMAAAQAERNSQTGQLRDLALKNANYGTDKTVELGSRIAQKDDAVISALQDKGRFGTFAAQQERLANDFTPVLGEPRFPGRYSNNAQRVPEGISAVADTSSIEGQRKAERAFLENQLNSLRQSGYSPLKVSGITSGINSVLNKPGVRASDVVQKTLGAVREKLASLTDDAGNIDARDLYTVRKEIGNTISTHAKESGNWDKRLASGLEKDIQGSIDSAIEKAGAGPLWQQYLDKYKTLSRPINQMQIGGALSSKLEPALMQGSNSPTRQNAEAFAKALRDGDRTASEATGFGRARLSDVLEPKQMALLDAIKSDLERSAYAKDAGRGVGSDTVQKLAQANLLDQAGIPNWMRTFAPTGILGNLMSRGADVFYNPANAKMATRLSDAMLNPKQVAGYMQAATPSQRAAMLANYARYGLTPLGMSAAAQLNAAK